MKRVILLTGILMLFISSCQKGELENLSEGAADSNLQQDLKTIMTVPFIVDKTISAGSAMVSDDNNGINIHITLTEGQFIQSHIYVSTTPPPKPAPGQFPYHGTIAGPGVLEFSVSYNELGASAGDDFYIAVHAEVSMGGGNESGWAIPDEGALYWYNKARKKIGWGAYFLFQSGNYPVITASPTQQPLSLVSGQVRYRNLRLDGPGPEVYLWPDGGFSPPYPADFQFGFDCDFNPVNGQYLFSPQVNHVVLVFVPFVEGFPFGSISTLTQVSNDFCQALPVPAAFGFNAIQLMVNKSDPGTGVTLKNLTINGFPVYGTFSGSPSAPMWNISGDILDDSGTCVMEADVELNGNATGEETNTIEIRFGTL